MPIPGAHYRVITTPKGHKIRLAFVGKRVVQTTPMPMSRINRDVSARSRGGFARLRPSQVTEKIMPTAGG